jgi:bifunctional DNase/RNase
MTAVHITELKDGVFFAEIQIRDSQSALLKVSARPSDAIAIALRTKSNILAESDLLDQVGIDIPERLIEGDGEVGSEESGAGSDSELERFREFLDQINPEDFAG